MSRTGIQLCYPFEEKRLLKWKPPFIIQPKLDGDRCRAVFDASGHVTLLSSEANEIKSVPHINESLEKLHLKELELDGELYVHQMPHERIHSIVSRSENNIRYNSEEMQFHVFDLVSTVIPQSIRLHALDHILEYPVKYIRNVPRFYAEDLSGIMSLYDYFIDDGYEGFVLRHKDSLYVRKRSTLIMKFKPKRSDFYRVVGFQEEISKDGIPKNSLGAIICQDDMGTQFTVGSGLTQNQRSSYWDLRSLLSFPNTGLFVEVKYQHLTEKRVPRFPVFVRLVSEKELLEGELKCSD